LGRLDHRVTLFEGRCHGLLTQDMLSSSRRI
jgi:hypothetical protein